MHYTNQVGRYVLELEHPQAFWKIRVEGSREHLSQHNSKKEALAAIKRYQAHDRGYAVPEEVIGFIQTVEGEVSIEHTKTEGHDLKTKEPNIGIFLKTSFNKRLLITLTWDEAREVAHELEHFADVCEHG